MRILLSRLTCHYTFTKPEATARLYESFAATEFSSSLDLMDAARQTSSQQRRVQFFQHAQDEIRHGELFLAQAKKIRKISQLPDRITATPDSENLYDQLGEIGFIAFVYHGENRGVRQFQSYLKYLESTGDLKNATVFAAVIADEKRHRSYSLNLLTESCGSPGKVRRRIQRAALWEARRRWQVLGAGISNTVFGAFAAFVLLLYAPIANWSGGRPAGEKNHRHRES